MTYEHNGKWFTDDDVELKHIKPWKKPQYWMGKPWDGWFVGISRHRDSDTLTRSNYEVFFNALLKIPASYVDDTINGGSPFCGSDTWNETPTIYEVNESHWAVGWIEWIAIHGSNSAALKLADEMLSEMKDYPVLDEDHWSELEYDEINRYWKESSIKYRIELCQDAHESIFGARHDHPPEQVFDHLRDTWQ
jgi:hypothetical protein